MKYLQYVPPEIVAKEAREALANRKKTDDEIWQDLLRWGLIRILDDGSVQVCFEREPDSGQKESPSPPADEPKSSGRRKKRG